MFLFVLFIATFNLGVGYVLGAGMNFGALGDRVLSLVPQRAAKKPVDVDIVDEPLTRPATAVTAAADKPEEESTPEYVLASLTTFREGLNSASVELNVGEEDQEKLEAAATTLQAAGQASPEESGDAVKPLEALNDANDVVASAASKAVSEGADQVAQIGSQVEDSIVGGLKNDADRPGLVEPLETTVEAPVEAAVTSEAAPSPVPELSASLDELFERLETVLTDPASGATQYVAAIRIDPIEGLEEDADALNTISTEIAKLTTELLAETHAYVAGVPAMALLEGDSFNEAKERLGQLRQRIEASTFTISGTEVKATVTCGLADANSGDQREVVLERIHQALDESARGGKNRVYHHDGVFPAAVDQRVEAEATPVA